MNHDCDRCGRSTPEDELQPPANEQIDDEMICPRCFRLSATARRAWEARKRGIARRAASGKLS